MAKVQRLRLATHEGYFTARHFNRTVILRRVLLKYIKMNKAQHTSVAL